jgi:hypothetical protein
MLLTSGFPPDTDAYAEAEREIQDLRRAKHLAVRQDRERERFHRKDLVVDEKALGLLPGAEVITMDTWRARNLRTAPPRPREQPLSRTEPDRGDAIHREEEVDGFPETILVPDGKGMGLLPAPGLPDDRDAMVRIMEDAIQLVIDAARKAVAQGLYQWADKWDAERPNPGLVKDSGV